MNLENSQDSYGEYEKCSENLTLKNSQKEECIVGKVEEILESDDVKIWIPSRMRV